MTTSRLYPDRPLVGIGIVVLQAGKVLLIRRGRPPGAGEWSLPGGAQRLGETAEEAARRELAEETGLRVGALALAGNVDSIHTDLDGKIEYHYTILDFCALYVDGTPRAGGDAQDIVWADCARLDDYALWDETIRIVRLSESYFLLNR